MTTTQSRLVWLKERFPDSKQLLKIMLNARTPIDDILKTMGTDLENIMDSLEYDTHDSHYQKLVAATPRALAKETPQAVIKNKNQNRSYQEILSALKYLKDIYKENRGDDYLYASGPVKSNSSISTPITSLMARIDQPFDDVAKELWKSEYSTSVFNKSAYGPIKGLYLLWVNQYFEQHADSIAKLEDWIQHLNREFYDFDYKEIPTTASHSKMYVEYIRARVTFYLNWYKKFKNFAGREDWVSWVEDLQKNNVPKYLPRPYNAGHIMHTVVGSVDIYQIIDINTIAARAIS